MSQPRPFPLMLGNLYFRCAMLLLLTFVVACGNSGGEKEALAEQINHVNEQVQLLESQTSATDLDATAKLERIKEDMRSVEDLIIEEDYTRAKRSLSALTERLRALRASQTDNRGTLDLQPFGKVEVKKRGEADFSEIDNLIDLSNVAAIRTSTRSALQLNPPNSTTHFFLSAQTELKVSTYEVSDGVFSFELVQGEFSFNVDKNHNLDLQMNQWKASLKGGAGELSHIPVTHSSHAALYKGSAKWQEGSETGLLSKYHALHWQDGKREGSQVPVAPSLDLPKNRDSILTAKGAPREIAFRWHSEIFIPSFHFQLSDQALFVTRLEDKMGVTSGGLELELPPGVYFWRVRGISDQGIPGPFSNTFKFQITENAGAKLAQAGDGSPKAKVKGPPIRNLEVEVLGGMAIISGRTDANAAVNVNGVAAVMIEAGQFSAVVNFTQRGEHNLRIIAANKETGGETVIERKVKIHF